MLPYDPKIDAVVRIAEGKAHGARNGEIVEARLTSFPDARRIAHGVVEERIGFLGEPGVDIEIVLRSHGLPPRFPQQVVEESETFPEEVGEDDLLGRRDFRDHRIVTIDGETAKDFDDAVEVERTAHGFRLGVHIADVSHYVAPGTALDERGALARDVGLFPGARAADAAGAPLQRPLLAESARGPARSLRDPRDRPEGARDPVRVRQGGDPERAPHDVHRGRAPAGDADRAPRTRAATAGFSTISGRWASSPPCCGSGASPAARSTSICRTPTWSWTTRGSSWGSCRSRATSRTA